jgi:hypothetical protein
MTLATIASFLYGTLRHAPCRGSAASWRFALLGVALGMLLAAPARSEARGCGVVRVPNWDLHVRTNGADCAAARDIARIAHNHSPSYPARINFNTRQFPRFASGGTCFTDPVSSI